MKTVNLTKLVNSGCDCCTINPRLLEIYQESLDYGDNWMIVCSSGNIFLSSHGLNKLLKNIVMDQGLIRKFLKVIKNKNVTHTLEVVKTVKRYISLWCCIEPLAANKNCQTLIIYFQPVKINKKVNQNLRKAAQIISTSTVTVPQKLDIRNLDGEDIRILGWLKFGFTQQQISDKLSISRSSVVRKITQICSKLNLEIKDTAKLRELLNLKLDWGAS